MVVNFKATKVNFVFNGEKELEADNFVGLLHIVIKIVHVVLRLVNVQVQVCVAIDGLIKQEADYENNSGKVVIMVVHGVTNKRLIQNETVFSVVINSGNKIHNHHIRYIALVLQPVRVVDNESITNF